MTDAAFNEQIERVESERRKRREAAEDADKDKQPRFRRHADVAAGGASGQHADHRAAENVHESRRVRHRWTD